MHVKILILKILVYRALSKFHLDSWTSYAHSLISEFYLLFRSLYISYSQSQESKIRCIMHYFERFCSCVPIGIVSFERKITAAPDADFWSKSDVSLCAFKVHSFGLIEDQPDNALEVDFANKYLGGGSLSRGCVQEEIRFMINPELIAGMLFLPRMDDNEAIEIVGAERFSCYTGYASSFRFAGEYIDKKAMDPFKRRRTRIVAIDALCTPKMRHFKDICLLREINKALCGFLNCSKAWEHQNIFMDEGDNEIQLVRNGRDSGLLRTETTASHRTPLNDVEMNREKPANNLIRDFYVEGVDNEDHEDDGVATGNWGCGVFGGDPELKATIQWLAASQTRRPFISYYTFGVEALRNLDQVTKWILSHKWTVGDLWNMMLEYSAQRLYKQTSVGFFSWLLPSLATTNKAIQPP